MPQELLNYKRKDRSHVTERSQSAAAVTGQADLAHLLRWSLSSLRRCGRVPVPQVHNVSHCEETSDNPKPKEILQSHWLVLFKSVKVTKDRDSGSISDQMRPRSQDNNMQHVIPDRNLAGKNINRFAIKDAHGIIDKF